MYSNVTVEIVEQPESKSARFRYECEGRTAGSICGVNSTKDVKTFPSIRILNYDGAAVVIVSCVTHNDKPYKPHPNCLVGKLCVKGVCKFDFTTKAAAPTIIKFPNLGIQCVKKTDVGKNLEKRKSQNIDPFKTGFHHMLSPKFINLHKIRLCFQVLLQPDVNNPKHLFPLKPVVSDVITDKQQTNMQLLIHDISDYTSPPSGGKKIMIFCDKVDKKDIRIRFYEEGEDGTVVWEDWAQFKSNNVHKQVAISFKTPTYKTQNVDKPVPVLFRLETISDRNISNSIPFQYVPDVSNIESTINSKKRKIDDSGPLYEFLHMHDANNRPKPNITNNIDPNEACAENIDPDNSNFIPSNFFASNNILPQHQLHYNSLPAHPSQSHNEQSFQQHSDRQQPHKADYQWPSSQQLHNIQPQQMHHNKSGNFQCQQPHYLQQQYQPISQLTTAPSYGNYLSPSVGYQSNFAASSNLSSNNISNCSRKSQSMTTYQNLIGDTCQIPLNYEGGPSSAHHSFQQMGHVYAADKVIIQQFCNNNLTFNQQQNVTDKQNMGDYSNPDLTLL